MRGIAQKHRPVGVPALCYRMTEQPPQVRAFDLIKPTAHFRHEACKSDTQCQRIVGQRPAFFGPTRAFLDGDNVAQPPPRRG